MKIDIITEPKERAWILYKISSMLKKYVSGFDVRILDKVDKNTKAKIVYFINYALYDDSIDYKSKGIKTMTWHTHPEDESFYEIAKKTDWIICQSNQYAEELRNMGCRATMIIPGIDDIFKPKLVLGIVGRKYDGTRKGAALVEKIRKLDFISLKFTHHSWEGDDIEFKNLPDFYNNIDYLLVPSSLEGGPIPVGEAIKCGKKVVAPLTVGNINEFKSQIIPYCADDVNSLVTILRTTYESRKLVAQEVEPLTWERFASLHKIIFKNLCHYKH